MLFLVTFARLVIVLLFAYSLATKVTNVQALADTITDFRLLPEKWSFGLAVLFLLGEGLVVITALLGGVWLGLTFALAAGLLTIFWLAMRLVLRRGQPTQCNCFGTSTKLVSSYDLLRNGGFIAVVGLGLIAWLATADSATLSLIEMLYIAIPALLFVVVWLNIGEFAKLWR